MLLDVKNLNNKFDNLSVAVKKLQKKSSALKEQNQILTDKVESRSDRLNTTENLLSEQSSKQDKQEYYSLRNNLIFLASLTMLTTIATTKANYALLSQIHSRLTPLLWCTASRGNLADDL